MTAGTTRVRGMAPRAATLALLDTVRGILTEYAAYLPMTLRQIFHRLAEAIPPDVLARIITDAINERRDDEAYAAVLAREGRTRAELADTLDRLLGETDNGDQGSDTP